MVRGFLAGHFKTIIDLGIGFRRFQKSISESVVVEATLVSKLSSNEEFEKSAYFSHRLNFFGNDVFILPSPDWTLCSFIENGDECVKSNMSQNQLFCGWCSLLMACMQGVHTPFCGNSHQL
jgi:hypothetical protein